MDHRKGIGHFDLKDKVRELRREEKDQSQRLQAQSDLERQNSRALSDLKAVVEVLRTEKHLLSESKKRQMQEIAAQHKMIQAHQQTIQAQQQMSQAQQQVIQDFDEKCRKRKGEELNTQSGTRSVRVRQSEDAGREEQAPDHEAQYGSHSSLSWAGANLRKSFINLLRRWPAHPDQLP